MSVKKLGIWYLFLWIAFFSILDFRANLIDWSFFTVTTMGDIIYLSGLLESFIMCFSSNDFLSSMWTLSWRFIGMRLPFWCLGWTSLWKLDLATWFFDLPMCEIRLGKFLAICSLNSVNAEMVLTWLLCTEEYCVTARPRWSNRSLPMRDLRPSATTVKIVEFDVHPLLVMGVCILPSTWIGSLENVLSCGMTFSWFQTACGLLFTTCVASDQLKILHALPESKRRVTNFERNIERLHLCYVIFN